MAQVTNTGATTVVSPGSNTALGGGAGQRDLFLKKFSGEVLATFNTKTVAKQLIRTRSVSGQKSAQFPAIGKATAEYHQPGQVILGQEVDHGEVILNIDDLLISSVFMSNFLEAMRHFETRGEYARQMADSLAQRYDQKVFATALKAAFDGATGPIADMGAATKVDIGLTPTAADLVDALFAAQQAFDEADVPEMDRCAVVTPAVYYDLVKDGRILNQDYGNGSNGGQARPGSLTVAGLPLIVSNNLAKDWSQGGADDLDVVRAGAQVTDYDVNASAVKALVLQKQALGAVHLMDLAVESEYQIERQGDLTVARMANGMGVLRTECIYAINAA